VVREVTWVTKKVVFCSSYAAVNESTLARMASFILQDVSLPKITTVISLTTLKLCWPTKHKTSPSPQRDLPSSLLQMNIPLKLPLPNSPHPKLILLIIILLHSNPLPILRHALHPRHMPQARSATIRLRDSAFLGRFVDIDFGSARRVVPEVGVAPVFACGVGRGLGQCVVSEVTCTWGLAV